MTNELNAELLNELPFIGYFFCDNDGHIYLRDMRVPVKLNMQHVIKCSTNKAALEITIVWNAMLADNGLYRSEMGNTVPDPTITAAMQRDENPILWRTITGHK